MKFKQSLQVCASEGGLWIDEKENEQYVLSAYDDDNNEKISLTYRKKDIEFLAETLKVMVNE